LTLQELDALARQALISNGEGTQQNANAFAMMAAVSGSKSVFGTSPWGFGVPQAGADARVAEVSSMRRVH
jgi:LDH2 family malate/lactate/ureidoglycolate dehydrogenase